jgi:hypothetical protein
MRNLLSIALAAIALILISTAAEARRPAPQPELIVCNQQGCGSASGVVGALTSQPAQRRHSVGDPRPGAWCAWWLRRDLQIPREAFRAASYNIARAFAYIGTAASGPGIGVIVVWSHHVGIITGQDANGNWIVKSGNDGGAVRERARSLDGAIAFRHPPGRGFAAL